VERASALPVENGRVVDGRSRAATVRTRVHAMSVRGRRTGEPRSEQSPDRFGDALAPFALPSAAWSRTLRKTSE
jgi:hypothetical protein